MTEPMHDILVLIGSGVLLGVLAFFGWLWVQHQSAAYERRIGESIGREQQALALLEGAMRASREHELRLFEQERLSAAAQLERIAAHHQDAMERFFPRATGIVHPPLSPEEEARRMAASNLWTDPEELRQMNEAFGMGETKRGGPADGA